MKLNAFYTHAHARAHNGLGGFWSPTFKLYRAGFRKQLHDGG